jgi:hypothetical protein
MCIMYTEATAEVPLHAPERKSEPLGVTSVQSEPLGISTPPQLSRDSSKDGINSPDTPASSQPAGLPSAAKAPPGFRPAGLQKDDEVLMFMKA